MFKLVSGTYVDNTKYRVMKFDKDIDKLLTFDTYEEAVDNILPMVLTDIGCMTRNGYSLENISIFTTRRCGMLKHIIAHKVGDDFKYIFTWYIDLVE